MMKESRATARKMNKISLVQVGGRGDGGGEGRRGGGRESREVRERGEGGGREMVKARQREGERGNDSVRVSLTPECTSILSVV